MTSPPPPGPMLATDDYVTCEVCGQAVFAMRFEREAVVRRHQAHCAEDDR